MDIEVDGDAIATVIFDFSGKVNVMNDEYLDAMDDIFASFEKRQRKLKGIIFSSAKSSFIVGGDLSFMGRAQKGQEAQLYNHFQRMKGHLRRLEKLPIPVVAALNGSALGGGLEFALSCNYRVATRKSELLLGLPEIDFAILPGAGGVVRLTNLIGLKVALGYLLSGKKVNVDLALEDGVIDCIVDSDQSMMTNAREWILNNPFPVQRWDTPRSYGNHMLDQEYRAEIQMAPVYLGDYATKDNTAALRITEIAVKSLHTPLDVVFREETRGLVELMLRPEAAELIRQFFETKALARNHEVTDN